MVADEAEKSIASIPSEVEEKPHIEEDSGMIVENRIGSLEKSPEEPKPEAMTETVPKVGEDLLKSPRTTPSTKHHLLKKHK